MQDIAIESIDKYLVNNKNNKVIKRNESSTEISLMATKGEVKSSSKSQKLINFCSQTITPNNSCSRIVLNYNTNFKTLRVEDPKRGTKS